MSNLRVFELLGSLSGNELESLTRFMAFNAPRLRPEVSRILEIYITQKQKNSLLEWDRPSIHKKLFSKQPYNDKKIRYLLSDLNHQCLQFVAYQEFKNNKDMLNIHASSGLAKRECERSFSAHLNRCKQAGDSSQRLSPDSYFSQYHLGMTEAEWQLNRGTRSPGEMEDVLEDLDKFYLVKKLQLCCEALNVSNILAKEQALFLLDDILQSLDSHKFREIPHISIYLEIINTLRFPEEGAHFTSLMMQLQLHANRIGEDDLREMFNYVLNYSIKKINQGEASHRKVLLDNYRLMIDNGILIQDGQVSQWHYKNLVTISLRQNELEFANTFIHEFRKHLATDVRENAFQYNLSYLRFAQERFKDAIKGLQNVDLDDVYYRLDARSILLKCYYELNDIDALFYQASSFRTFIRRNRSVSGYQKTVYSNLIKLTLALARAGLNKTRLKRVRERLNRDSRVADLQWIEAKLSELGA